MNIKRAFFAAAAALMLPGFAMAQQDITVPTSVDFTPDADTVVLTATLSCNAGSPLSQDGQVSEGNNVTFSVLNQAVGSTCDVSVSGVPAGWTATDCSFTTNDTTTEYPYAIRVTQTGIEFTVNKVWDDPEGVLDDMDWAEVDVTCENLMGGNTFETTTFFYVGDADSDGEDSATFFPGVANDTDEEDEMTVCYAEEVMFSDSQVGGDAGCEDGTVYEFGGETEQECTITNSVVFEGIPTLSQYGMAIMVLLMLGVGFVGFRRFV